MQQPTTVRSNAARPIHAGVGLRFPKFRVRGGTFEAVEGKARDRNIVIEFKDYETALACYRSPEYTKARALRAGAVDIDIIVIEGYDGPQPTD
jgi:uncharacterized protein (DUF1330 family)